MPSVRVMVLSWKVIVIHVSHGPKPTLNIQTAIAPGQRKVAFSDALMWSEVVVPRRE
jgi:hypothetical protein